MKKVIRIGSRDSLLARTQVEIVVREVRTAHPELEFELLAIKTTGDKILERRLDQIGGKGLFVKELEQALAAGRIDLAVHSYKDVPYAEPPELPTVALSKRESPFDVLVLPEGSIAGGAGDNSTGSGAGASAPGSGFSGGAPDTPTAPGLAAWLSQIDLTKPVGSSSLRRSIQLRRLCPDLRIESVRGNVLTRLAKLDSGAYSALILAEAGLRRLDLAQRISYVFNADEMIPSGSQGILAIQGKQDEDYSYLDCFNSRESQVVSQAERQFLKSLDGGCTSPVAVYGQLQGDCLELRGMYVDSADRVAIGSISAAVGRAQWAGESLAMQLKQRLENR